MIHTGLIKGKRDMGQQSMTYLIGLNKLMAEQGLGEIIKRQNLNLQETGNVVSHDRLLPDRTTAY